MASNTKTSESKPRTEGKRRSPTQIPISRANQDLMPKVRSTTDQPQYSHTLQQSHDLLMISLGGLHHAFTQPLSQSCGKFSNHSIAVQPSHYNPSVPLQQGLSTKGLFVSQCSCVQHANYSPAPTDQQKKGLHLPMTTHPYSSIERWESQVPTEDAWSTCVVLESGVVREPICENMDMMRELAVKGLFGM